jgi:cell division protein FtsW
LDILKYIKGDKIIWMVIVLLSFFSLLAVYSSTGTLAYKYQSGNTEYYLIKHLFILVFGFLLIYGTHLIKYTYYSRLAQIALYTAVPLLFFTLVFGSNLNNASRWLTIPVINMSFQTSDLAKVALIMYLARVLVKKQNKMGDFKEVFVSIMLPAIVTCALIFPANLSTAASLFVTSLVIMFIGRVNFKHIAALIGLGLVALMFVFTVGKAFPSTFPRLGTWTNRIENFSSGGEKGSDNYQADQSKIAISTGGILGKGPGNSMQRNFLPHPYSDFIYAIIAEEYGFVGASLVLLFYLILLFRAVRIVQKTTSTFASLLAIGLCFSLVFQAMINMGVAVNIFPVTGQALPFVSMGGTSIWFSSIAIGIIISISREIEEEAQTTNNLNIA